MSQADLAKSVRCSQNTDVDRGAAAIGTGAGASAQYFGHADVEKARAGGASNEQIAAYIKNNPGLLRGGNVAGGGGLYDEFKRYM
jgi:hypothetical protein